MLRCPWTSEPCDCQSRGVDDWPWPPSNRVPKRCQDRLTLRRNARSMLNKPPLPREEFWAKWDGCVCPYCQKPMQMENSWRRPTRDHVVPRSKKKGGVEKGVPTIVIACYYCNQGKGNQTLGDWYAKLVDESDPRASHVLAFLEEREAKQRSKP